MEKENMFPVAEYIGKQIVSLPMFYAMKVADVARICVAMREVLVLSSKLRYPSEAINLARS